MVVLATFATGSIGQLCAAGAKKGGESSLEESEIVGELLKVNTSLGELREIKMSLGELQGIKKSIDQLSHVVEHALKKS